MKKFKFGSLLTTCFMVCVFVLPTGLLSAREKGIPTENIKNAFRMILAETDKNKDGKLSLQECLGMSKDPKQMEKNCKYWDANSDGFITEEEYIQQVKKIERR